MRLSALALAVAVLGLALPAEMGATEVQSKLSGFAKDIEKLLKEEGQSDVAIGEITGPPSLRAASGPGLQAQLTAELAARKIKVNPDAFIFIKGEYQPIEEERNKDALIVELTLTIRTKKGKKFGDLTARLDNKATDEFPKLLGLNVDMGRFIKGDNETRNEEMKKQVENPPPVKIAETKIKAHEDSNYAVEVFVKRKGESEFKAVVPEKKDGKAFVDLKRGDVYKLRLHNAWTLEAPVSVTVDGVDAFQFFEEKDKKKPAYFLVAPTNKRDVEGWVMDTKEVSEFEIGSFSNSPAAKTIGSAAKLGAITVCFHPCWTGKDPPKELEGARNIDPDATIQGPKIKRESKVLPRTIGPMVAAVTIRYSK